MFRAAFAFSFEGFLRSHAMRILCGEALSSKVADSLAKLPRDKVKELLGLVRFKEAEMGLTLQAYVELSIRFRCCGIACLKAFWLLQFEARKTLFPSYPVFHKWFARIEKLLDHLMGLSLCPLGQRLGFVDSMKLPIGFEGRFIKSMGKAAGVGHSSTGKFYGIKLHALIRDDGLLCARAVTSASVHDLTPIKDGLLKGHRGRVYGDRGYVGQDVRFALMNDGIDFWARPKENMGHATDWSFEYVREFEARHAKQYRKRMGIERFFARLKRGFGLSVLGLRSRRMAGAYVAAAILTSQWLALGELKVTRVV